MTDGPTTMNGPLHTPNVATDDRMMSATFASQALAEQARASLVEAGIAAERITLAGHAADDASAQASTQPDDRGILGRLREAVLPEDSRQAPREAVRRDDAILELRPLANEVETATRILEASHPQRFDAALERWRNA